MIFLFHEKNPTSFPRGHWEDWPLLAHHQDQQRQSSSGFPTKQLFFLAICRVAEPIALTSIFPYSWLMVKSFHVGESNDASFYAGVLISAFALSECATGMFWGGLSDRVGRKPVLLLGCVGTMLSLLIVGFATNYWVALAGRVIGGVLNGNIGVIQTMVGELVTNPEHEPRAYSVMPFVWSIGTIIGPAIGGTFAQPAETFPDTFSPAGIFGRYQYLLPNLICAALMLISIVLGYAFLEETHPHFRSMQETTKYIDPKIAVPEEHTQVQINVTAGGYGTFNNAVSQNPESFGEEEQEVLDEKPTHVEAPKPRIMTFQIIMLLLALGLFSYHSMCFDHLLPIFLQDSADETAVNAANLLPPGLGMTTFQVGTILSVSGISALFIQAVVFPLLASYMPATRLLFLVTLLHPLAYIPMPFLAILPNKLIFPGIYTALGFRNFTSIIAYPLLLILLKQACPSSSMLGKINGLAASVGAATRTVAPPLAGFLYAWGSDIGFTGLAWWGSAVVAIIGALQIFFVQREKPSIIIYEAIPGEEVVVNVEGADAHTYNAIQATPEEV